MKTFILAAALTPIMTTVWGAPAPAPGGVFVCEDVNFNEKGRCQHLQFLTGNCHDLNNGLGDMISSIRPDEGFVCTLWEKKDCNGKAINIEAPGNKNLHHHDFHDKASSYRCVEKGS